MPLLQTLLALAPLPCAPRPPARPQAFTAAIASLVHPVCVHWLWGADSWLGRVSACRPLDFAGGTVVHMIGGLFGIVGAVFVGPRLGRFEGGAVKEMPGHDMGWVTIGTLSLWWALLGGGVGAFWRGGGGAAARGRASRRPAAHGA
jgi:Amt family ammonium transporter